MKSWKGYQKGVNLGGWFSQCDYSQERFDHFIEHEDIVKLAGWGLDHLRLPVDYNLVETESGEYIEEGFARIEQVVAWCGEVGLNLVLDLHKTYGYSFDKGENQAGFFENADYQERFYRLWEQFAARFGRYAGRVAFELLNEVTDQAVCQIWNSIAETCVKRIRAIAPDTDILIGGYWNNAVAAVKDLPMPFDDHIIYNCHCYSPIVFTHQGAPWVDGMPHNFRLAYNGTYGDYDRVSRALGLSHAGPFCIDADPAARFGADYFEKEFAEAVRVAEERGVALYCGEYGVINLATPEDTLSWYQAIHQVFVRHGIGRSAWSYREMDFGLSDDHMLPVIEELKKFL